MRGGIYQRLVWATCVLQLDMSSIDLKVMAIRTEAVASLKPRLVWATCFHFGITVGHVFNRSESYGHSH